MSSITKQRITRARRCEPAGRSNFLTATTACFLLLLTIHALASPLAPPGDLRLRHDLQLLDDAGLINVPLTSWPLAWADIAAAVREVDTQSLTGAERAAWQRVQSVTANPTNSGNNRYRFAASAAVEPRTIRTFANTPREEGEVSTGMVWSAGRFNGNLSIAAVAHPDDGQDLRPDGSYAGLALGNWLLSAGWQERWWGPGHDGSLVLSNNARPIPAVAVQRLQSHAFTPRWLRWIGPWSLSGFMGVLDDSRSVDNALLFGLRATFRPVRSLEIGLSRTAQWCGEERPCNGSTFVDLLLGNDNRGINVDPAREPGNQLGGFDLRWSLPGEMPLAVYAQWVGEDTRKGGPEIGSWLRLAGVELFGAVDHLSYRAHFEIAETSCRDGGLGFSSLDADCAYEHSIYTDGYRYRDRSLGHGMDGDGLAYSLGSTLVQSAGHAWSVVLRRMEINRVGQPSARHTLSAGSQDRLDLQVSHRRNFASGVLGVGVGFRRVNPAAGSTKTNGVTGFIQWSMQ